MIAANAFATAWPVSFERLLSILIKLRDEFARAMAKALRSNPASPTNSPGSLLKKGTGSELANAIRNGVRCLSHSCNRRLRQPCLRNQHRLLHRQPIPLEQP